VAAMYMAAHIAREEDRGTLGSDCSRFRPRAAGTDPERQAENSAGGGREPLPDLFGGAVVSAIRFENGERKTETLAADLG
jgi:hypothetical protein